MIPNIEPEYHLIVDVRLRRPAGVWVQIANDMNVEIIDLFNTSALLDHPTKDLREVKGTKAMWRRFADQCNRENP